MPPDLRRAEVLLGARRRDDHVLGPAGVLDEHLLHEPVRFLHILVVMALTDVTDVGELLNPKLATAFTECLERILRLARHDDVAHEAKEIALTGRVGEILRHADRRPSSTLQGTADVLEGTVVAV